MCWIQLLYTRELVRFYAIGKIGIKMIKPLQNQCLLLCAKFEVLVSGKPVLIVLIPIISKYLWIFTNCDTTFIEECPKVFFVHRQCWGLVRPWIISIRALRLAKNDKFLSNKPVGLGLAKIVRPPQPPPKVILQSFSPFEQPASHTHTHTHKRNKASTQKLSTVPIFVGFYHTVNSPLLLFSH